MVFLLLQPISCTPGLPASQKQGGGQAVSIGPIAKASAREGLSPVGRWPPATRSLPSPFTKEGQRAGLDLLPGDGTRIRVSTFPAFQVAAGGAY